MNCSRNEAIMKYSPVTVANLPSSPAPRNIMRRLGAVDLADSADIENNFRKDWLSEAMSHCSFKGVWMLLPAEDLPFTGDLVGRMISGCNWAVLMAVTAGEEISLWIKELFEAGNGAKGAFADAVASEGVEAALSYMQKMITISLVRNGISVKKARISPGFGDFLLAEQCTMLQMLDCRERLGISVNNAFIMSPEKSATALTGAFEIIQTTNTGVLYDS